MLPASMRRVVPRQRASRLLGISSSPPSHFVESLSEVASVVSSRTSIDEVLERVVDEAKVLVRCRKALLWLFDEESDEAATRDSVVLVRGSRDQYPETWWRSCLEQVGHEVLESGTPQLLEDRGHDAVLACVPVKSHDRTIGLLSAINGRARSFSEDQMMLLAVLGAFAGTAIENARLRGQSEYALLAGERNRIAKEMHDGLAQSLFSASLSIEVCKRKVRTAPDDIEQKLGETQELLSDSLAELRRYIFDLRPVSIERLGLVGAIDSKLEEIERAGRLQTSLRVTGRERPLAPSAEACLYRVMQEAVANVVKHASARSVLVTLNFATESVELLVQDDGAGFDVEQAATRAETGKSLGFRSMRDRVSAEGGRLKIHSAPGEGTNLCVTLPS